FVFHADRTAGDPDRGNAKRGLTEGVFTSDAGGTVSGGAYLYRNRHSLCAVTYGELAVNHDCIFSALRAAYTRRAEADGREFLNAQDVRIHLFLDLCAIARAVFGIEDGDLVCRERELDG